MNPYSASLSAGRFGLSNPYAYAYASQILRPISAQNTAGGTQSNAMMQNNPQPMIDYGRETSLINEQDPYKDYYLDYGYTPQNNMMNFSNNPSFYLNWRG